MTSPFEVFNRTLFTLKRVTSPTSSHFDSNDKIVPATITDPPPQIQGHLYVVDRSGRETQWSPSQMGTVEQGRLRLTTETLLQKGDVIEAAQEGDLVYRYTVLGMVRSMRMIARLLNLPVRFEYDMQEIPQ